MPRAQRGRRPRCRFICDGLTTNGAPAPFVVRLRARPCSCMAGAGVEVLTDVERSGAFGRADRLNPSEGSRGALARRGTCYCMAGGDAQPDRSKIFQPI